MPANDNHPPIDPSINRVILIGFVSSAVVVRRSKRWHYTNFTLTTTEYRTARNGDLLEERERHTCELRRESLDAFEACVDFGTLLRIDGKLTHRVDDKGGVLRTWTTVRVESYRVLAAVPCYGGGNGHPMTHLLTVVIPDGVRVLATSNGKPHRFPSIPAAEAHAAELRGRGVPAEPTFRAGGVLLAVEPPHARSREAS
jgi:hypothetical protein